MQIEKAKSEKLDMILGDKFPVLDQGFVRVCDYMGNDSAVVQAARTSCGKGTKQANEDRDLIRYLMRHDHTTPFEMCEIKFHVKAPMDVWRQWIRHRTASVNEVSSRYSLIDEMGTLKTLPDKWRTQSKNNKQGSGEFFPIEDGNIFTAQETEIRELTLKHYKSRTDKGMAREQARKDLVLSTYTEAYWKIDLKNLLNFLKLRMHPHAQLEIRTYANTMAEIVKKWVPMTWEAFEDYCLDSVKFSKKETQLLSLKDGYSRVCKAKSFGWIDENYDPNSNGKIQNFCLERREFEEKTKAVFGNDFDVWHNFLNCF